MKYILAILLILFASYADIFLYRVSIVPVPPAEFLIPLFMVLFVLKYPLKDYIDILKAHTFKLLLVTLVLSVIYAVISKSTTEIIKEIIVLNIISLILYVFAVHFFRTENKKITVIVMLTAFITLAGSVWYDFFIGLPKANIDYALNLRKGGFGENPNQGSSGIKFLAFGVLLLLSKAKLSRNLIIVFMITSVFLTFSRSGVVSVILILIFGIMNNWVQEFRINAVVLFKSFFKMLITFSILYSILLVFSNVIKENFPGFTEGSAGQRIDLLLGKSNKSIIAEDTQSGGRGDLFFSYLSDFANNPIGYGTGYTSDQHFNSLNTHNYYLYMAVNYGFFALIIYLIYLGYSMKLAIRLDHFYYSVFVVLLIFEGFISHSIFYERAILVSLAFFDSQIYRKC